MRRYLYETWYGAAVVAGAALIVVYGVAFADVMLQYSSPDWCQYLLLGLLFVFAVALLNCLVAVGVSLVRRAWKTAVAQFGMFVGVIVLFVAASSGLWFYNAFCVDKDHFADNLSIPADVECEEPEPYDDEHGRPHVFRSDSDFALAASFQGGLYEYKATVSPDEDGEVYLKAYEVTKNYPLSVGRLKERTLEKVEKGTRTVGKEFTIYEGDWGQYYAVRFEIWFISAGGGAERKLKEKVFKIDGWMR